MYRHVVTAATRVTGVVGPTLLLVLFALLDVTGRTMAALLETLALPALVSLVTRAVVSPATVGWAAGWAMFGTLIYEVTPAVFPETVDATAREGSFRAVTAATAVGVGVVVEGAALKGWFTGSPVAGVGLRWLAVLGVAGALAYGAVLWRLHAGTLLAADGPLAALLDGVARFSNVQESEPGRLEGALLALFALGLCLLPCAFLGTVAFLVSIFYPLPELAVLVYVGAGVLGDGRVGLPADAWTVQVDRRLAVGVAAATWGLKGTVSMAFVVLGMLVSAFPFLMFVVPLGAVVSNLSLAQALSIPPGGWFVLTLFFLTTGLLGGYGLWFWLRVVDRLPRFLDAWAAAQPTDVATDWTWERRPPSVARPPGILLPWAALFVALPAVAGAIDSETGLLPPAYAVTWLGLLAGVGWYLRRSLSAEPQDPLSDDVAIPAALAVQVFAMGVAIGATSEAGLVGAIARLRVPPPGALIDAVPVVLLVWWLVGVYYLHDAFTHSDADGPSRFVLEALFVPFGLAVAVYGWLVDLLPVAAFGAVMAIVLLGAGAGLRGVD